MRGLQPDRLRDPERGCRQKSRLPWGKRLSEWPFVIFAFRLSSPSL